MGREDQEKPTKRPTLPAAKAFQATSADGRIHVVGLGNLRVMVTNDDGSWFAQGLEVDFFVQGTDLNDVMRRFEEGLAATIRDYVESFGSIEALLRPAPPAVWEEFGKIAAQPYLFSQISVLRHEVSVRAEPDVEYRQPVEYYPMPVAA